MTMNVHSWLIDESLWDAAWAGWPQDALLLAERFDRVVFADLKDESSSQWDQGHLFTTDWHLAWRKLGDRYRVVLVGEAVLEPAASWEADVEPLSLPEEGSREEAVLWGVKNTENTDEWIELYIPQIMSIPEQHPASSPVTTADESVRRMLQYTTYRDPETSEVVFHRYTGIRIATATRNGFKSH